MSRGEAVVGPEAPPAVPGGAARMPPGPQRYAAVLDRLDEVVFQTDVAGNWTYLNHAWERLTGYPVADSIGKAFLDYVHPEEREPTLELFQRVVQSRATHCEHETRYRTSDGGYRWVGLRAATVLDERGEYVGNVGTMLDVTERRAAERLLADEARILGLLGSQRPLHEILQAVADLLAEHLRAPVTLTSFPALPGLAPSRRSLPATELQVTVTGGRPSDTRAPGPAATRTMPIRSTTDGARIGSCVLHRPRARPPEADPEPVEHLLRLVAIAIESTTTRAEARVRELHDPLTGLPNRTLVVDRLQRALHRAAADGSLVAVLLLDLDGFRAVNDSCGRDTGDWVLQVVAARVERALRPTDVFCRLGGDEFTIVLPELHDQGAAERVAGKVRDAVAAPLIRQHVTLRLGASVGVALSTPARREHAEELVRRADAAMHRAKRLGTGQAVYSPLLDEQRMRSLGLVAELRRAIEDGELRLDYQPKVDVARRRTVGVECLVRWAHPTRGLVAPAEFIPLAERTGVIKPLSEWVLRTALAESRPWRRAGMGGVLAVNLSAQSLHDPDLPELIGSVLAEADIGGDGASLELEVTESALMAEPESALAAAGQLCEAGVPLAIDDFGTGYSSLAYLKRLPAGCIKIDRSFVTDMTSDERDASIVRAAIGLAHDLDLDVVAEGVESQRTCELLVELGCHLLQGYHFARPMPAAQLLGWLHAQPA